MRCIDVVTVSKYGVFTGVLPLKIIRLLLVIALEKKLFYCEQASRLISFLCGRVINSREIGAGA